MVIKQCLEHHTTGLLIWKAPKSSFVHKVSMWTKSKFTADHLKKPLKGKKLKIPFCTSGTLLKLKKKKKQ